MKYMPKISAIIPTYNRVSYLPDAINSILSQDYNDFEIIVVDDGSTDNTRGLVEQFVKINPDKIKYLYQDNKGPGEARNNGICNSRREYVSFLCADDGLLENAPL